MHRRQAIHTLAALAVSPVALAQSSRRRATANRSVLVELFTSQGCNMCPEAEKLLGRLPELGYGPEKVVPIAFHVDYFNDPWKDPLSDKFCSARQWAYHQAFQNRNSSTPNLYFTPMLLVDGRYPFSGYDAQRDRRVLQRVLAAIDSRLGERAPFSLELLPDKPPSQGADRTIRLAIKSSSNRAQLKRLAAVALVEDPIITKVASGENANKTLTENRVVRSFQSQPFQLDGGQPVELSIPVKVPAGADLRKLSLAAFIQDESTGYVEQARAFPWLDTAVESSGR